MDLKRPESVLVVLYDYQHRILVLQRDDDPDFWQSVTGTLEPDELPMQTALREVKEETGIDLVAGGHLLVDCRHTNQYEIRPQWRHRYPIDVSINTEYVFSAQVSGNEAIALTEHLSYEWLPKHEAVNKVWSSTNKDAISRFVPGV